jgi:hypothetical protein
MVVSVVFCLLYPKEPWKHKLWVLAIYNLLKIGMPFTENYKFHTKNAIKHKKNMTNRKRAKLNDK